MDEVENKEERELREISSAYLAKLRDQRDAPSPYMRTRLLAMIREKKSESRRLRFWRIWGLSGGMAAAALLVVFAIRASAPASYFGGTVNRDMAIRLDLSAEAPQVAFIEINLPEGVQFFSKSYPELASRRVLLLEKPAGSSLPIVVRSADSGVRDVKVKFLDSEKRVVAMRTLRIRFAQRAST